VQIEVDTLKTLIHSKSLIQGRAAKVRQMIRADVAKLKEANDGLLGALFTVIPSHKADVQATLERLQAQYAEMEAGFQ
jgi:metal-responsive CopG/Arc/MetJ family transcriptional regulator